MKHKYEWHWTCSNLFWSKYEGKNRQAFGASSFQDTFPFSTAIARLDITKLGFYVKQNKLQGKHQDNSHNTWVTRSYDILHEYTSLVTCIFSKVLRILRPNKSKIPTGLVLWSHPDSWSHRFVVKPWVGHLESVEAKWINNKSSGYIWLYLAISGYMSKSLIQQPKTNPEKRERKEDEWMSANLGNLSGWKSDTRHTHRRKRKKGLTRTGNHFQIPVVHSPKVYTSIHHNQSFHPPKKKKKLILTWLSQIPAITNLTPVGYYILPKFNMEPAKNDGFFPDRSTAPDPPGAYRRTPPRRIVLRVFGSHVLKGRNEENICSKVARISKKTQKGKMFEQKKRSTPSFPSQKFQKS